MAELDLGEEEISGVTRLLLPYVNSRRLILLEGEPGSGKTTLVAALMRAAGFTGKVQSPTYALMNQYVVGADFCVYHFDLYRLSGATEAEEAGIVDLLSEEVCRLVEWPQRLGDAYYIDAVHVSIENRGNRRRYRITEKKTV